MDKYDEKARELLCGCRTTNEAYRVDIQSVNPPLEPNVAHDIAWVAQALRDVAREVREDDSIERRVADWVKTRIGDEHMQSRERAMRLFEEATELIQAEGVPQDLTMRQVDHVYARPAGDPKQEAAGVAVTLLGWCAANGTTFNEIARRELERIEAKPIAQIRGSVARKSDADLVTCVTPPGVEQTGSGQECAARLRQLASDLSEYFGGELEPIPFRIVRDLREIAALAQPCQPAMTRQEAERIADAALCNPAHVYTRHWLPGSYRELRDSVADALQRMSGGEDTRVKQLYDIVTRELAEPGVKESTGMLMRIAEICEERAAISAHRKEPKE